MKTVKNDIKNIGFMVQDNNNILSYVKKCSDILYRNKRKNIKELAIFDPLPVEKWQKYIATPVEIANPNMSVKDLDEYLNSIGIMNKGLDSKKPILRRLCYVHKHGDTLYFMHYKEVYMRKGKRTLLTWEDLLRKFYILHRLCSWGILRLPKGSPLQNYIQQPYKNLELPSAHVLFVRKDEIANYDVYEGVKIDRKTNDKYSKNEKKPLVIRNAVPGTLGSLLATAKKTKPQMKPGKKVGKKRLAAFG